MKSDSKRGRAWVALVAGVLLISACGGGATTTTAAPGTTAAPTTAAPTTAAPSTTAGAMLEHIPFAVGAMVDQTGRLSAIVEAVSQPLNMAVAEINAVSPDLVSVAFADDGSLDATASQNIDQFLTGDYNAVFGPLASGVAVAVWDKVNTAGMNLCSGTSTGAAFSTAEYNPNHFRTAPSDDIQGPLLADLMVGDGFTNVAVVWQATVYGEGFGNAVADAAEAGGATVALRTSYDDKQTSFTDLAQDIVASGAEALAMIGYAEGGQIVLDLASAGWDGPVYVADGFVDNVNAGTLGGRADLVTGYKATYPSAAPATGEPTFGDRFAAFAPAGTPQIFSAHMYDCFVVMTLAAQVAQSNVPTEYVDEVIGVTRDGEKCTLVADCLEKVWAGVDIDYDGASGKLDFTENGEPGIGTYDTLEFTGEAGEDPDPADDKDTSPLLTTALGQIEAALPTG